MSRRLTLLRAYILLASAGAMSMSARAEATVSGVLTDPQGKAVAGATIRLFHGSGPLVTEAQTDNTGHFTFLNITAGDNTSERSRHE